MRPTFRRVAMFRSILVWTLTAAFLVTIPVTGAGPCPCRFVKVLHTPTAQPAALVPATPPKCKCCPVPTHCEDDQQKPTPPAAPTDGPCDHHFGVDAAVAGGPGEWSEHARGLWDANPAVDAGGHGALCLAPDVVKAPVAATHPRPCAHLRFAHSFRS